MLDPIRRLACSVQCMQFVSRYMMPTSIGDRKVTVRFIWPACISYIVLVGVNRRLVMFAEGVSSFQPIQV